MHVFSATPYTTETKQGLFLDKMMKNVSGCCRASGKPAEAEKIILLSIIL